MSGPLVIKYGGSLLEDLVHREAFLKNVAALSKIRPLILVHGGGKEISRQMEAAGIKPRFVNGRRFTDADTMRVVEEALSGLNKHLVTQLVSDGADAKGFSGKTLALVRARVISQELGLVGEPEAVNEAGLKTIISQTRLPVFYSVAGDSKGQSLNINADDFALAIAMACRSTRLIFLTDTGAILDKQKNPIPAIESGDVESLIADGTITGGMMIKARACVEALRKGVGRVDICKGIASLLNPSHPLEGTSFVL